MEVVLVALIGGPLMWLLHRFDKKNTNQHAEGQAAADRRQQETMQAIEQVGHKIDNVDQRLDDHIGWHLGSNKRVG